jgi:hypothetical protein
MVLTVHEELVGTNSIYKVAQYKRLEEDVDGAGEVHWTCRDVGGDDDAGEISVEEAGQLLSRVLRLFCAHSRLTAMFTSALERFGWIALKLNLGHFYSRTSDLYPNEGAKWLLLLQHLKVPLSFLLHLVLRLPSSPLNLDSPSPRRSS